MRALLTIAIMSVSLAYAQPNIQVVPDHDPFTDENRSGVYVLADTQPSYGTATVIGWRCNGNDDYELFVSIDEYLSNDRIPIVYRFDSAEAESNTWIAGTEGTSAFANHGQKQRFTLSAIESERVIIGLTDYRGYRHDRAFSLTGLRPHLEELGCVELQPHPS